MDSSRNEHLKRDEPSVVDAIGCVAAESLGIYGGINGLNLLESHSADSIPAAIVIGGLALAAASVAANRWVLIMRARWHGGPRNPASPPAER